MMQIFNPQNSFVKVVLVFILYLNIIELSLAGYQTPKYFNAETASDNYLIQSSDNIEEVKSAFPFSPFEENKENEEKEEGKEQEDNKDDNDHIRGHKNSHNLNVGHFVVKITSHFHERWSINKLPLYILFHSWKHFLYSF